jgi:magnesium-protoporphyrin IX monomethyl ester (oxidative) cyclase
VRTQGVLNRKHLGVAALKATASIMARLALRRQTNFLKMLWKFGERGGVLTQRAATTPIGL